MLLAFPCSITFPHVNFRNTIELFKIVCQKIFKYHHLPMFVGECVGLALALVKILTVFVADMLKLKSIREPICSSNINGEETFAAKF